MRSWHRIDEFIGQLEKWLIVILLGAMVLVAFGQIILRNVFSTGLAWGEPLVRYLVLWVGFTGAALATREGKHITIELFSVLKNRPPSRFLAAVSHLSSAVICGLLALAAVKFLRFEAQMGSASFFGVPAWLPELIIPVTFTLMTIRYLLKAVANIGGRPDESPAIGSRGDR
jgi:TRAP-type C4-dicarboxylate transport system permease small subunit